MRVRLWVVLLLATGLAATTAAQQTPSGQPQDAMPGMSMSHSHAAWAKPDVPAGVLRIVFNGKSTDWSLAQLAALPHTSITVFNAHAKANQTYSGIPLIDLLVKAGVPGDPHGRDLALYFAAIGSDGYIAAYAVAEANPLLHDGTILVADALDGKPLTTQGPLMIVATGEKKPARWVRNLVEVKVQAAE